MTPVELVVIHPIHNNTNDHPENMPKFITGIHFIKSANELTFYINHVCYMVQCNIRQSDRTKDANPLSY